MKKAIYLFIALSVISCSGLSQNTYKTAVGLRVGDGYYDLISASLKTFIGDSPGAVELNIGFRNYGYYGFSWFNLSASLSYQYHFDISAVKGLKWFVGAGATAFNTFSSYKDYKGFGLGIFPTAGADYKFANIPLDVSFDIRPTIGIIKPYTYYDNFYLGNVGVSARYTIR